MFVSGKIEHEKVFVTVRYTLVTFGFYSTKEILYSDVVGIICVRSAEIMGSSNVDCYTKRFEMNVACFREILSSFKLMQVLVINTGNDSR